MQHGDDRRDDLKQELDPRGEIQNVIQSADNDDEHCPQQDALHGFGDLHEQHNGQNKAQKDGQAAHPGDGVIVHAPCIARHIYGTDLLRESLDDRCGGKADHKRNAKRDENVKQQFRV